MTETEKMILQALAELEERVSRLEKLAALPPPEEEE